MLPLKIGACLRVSQVGQFRDWLFDDARDLELQDFMTHDVLKGDWRSVVASAKKALDGFEGRLGIHGPYEGLDIDNKDADLRPIITERFLLAM